MRFRFLAFGVLGLATLLPLVPLACGSKAQLGGQGASCNVVSDCQDGLICIPQKNGSSICSSNVGSVQQLPPIPDSGAAQPASDADDNDSPGILIPLDAAGD